MSFLKILTILPLFQTLGLWDLDESVSRDGFQSKGIDRGEEWTSAKGMTPGPSRGEKSGVRKRKDRLIKDTQVGDAFVEVGGSKSSADHVTGSSEDQLMESLSMVEARCEDESSRFHRLVLSTRVT